MPFVDLDGNLVHYHTDGNGAAPVLVFSNSIGSDLSMWNAQAAALCTRFRVLRYDSRGHGRSGLPPGRCSIRDLAVDVLKLLDSLGVKRVHFCGLSIGGLVGMWLAAHSPERIDRLILCNTAAAIGTPEIWDQRIRDVRQGGLGTIAHGLMERWFSAAFRTRSPELVDAIRDKLLTTSPEGYIASCEAIRDNDQRDAAAGIRIPTMVIAGTADTATPPQQGRSLAAKIKGARYAELDAGHLSNIERPREFNREVNEFLMN